MPEQENGKAHSHQLSVFLDKLEFGMHIKPVVEFLNSLLFFAKGIFKSNLY